MYTIVCAEAISSDALCGASSRSSEIFREGVRGRSTQRRQNRRPIESNELPSPSTRKSDRQPLADAISGLGINDAETVCPTHIGCHDFANDFPSFFGLERIVFQFVLQHFQLFADQIALHPLIGPDFTRSQERPHLQATAPVIPDPQPMSGMLQLATISC